MYSDITKYASSQSYNTPNRGITCDCPRVRGQWRVETWALDNTAGYPAVGSERVHTSAKYEPRK